MSSRERAAMRVTFRPVASIFSARWSTATLLGAATSTCAALPWKHGPQQAVSGNLQADVSLGSGTLFCCMREIVPNGACDRCKH